MLRYEHGTNNYFYVLPCKRIKNPPPTINTSSQTDGWSKKQEDLLVFCQQNKLPMIFAWGPFGHASRPNMANSAVYDFPWLDIVKNAAYPVFTNTDTDNVYPGHQNTTGKDQKGLLTIPKLKVEVAPVVLVLEWKLSVTCSMARYRV